MPNVAETNVTAGELSPTMLGRADVARYANGCLRLENFILTVTGMVSYRPGFGLMGLPKATGKPFKLRRFQFSDQQGYCLELGEKYFRIWHPTGQIVDATSHLPIEVVTPFLSANLGLLGFTQSADFLFVVDETQGVLAIKRMSHTSWSIEVFQLKDGPYGAHNADTGKILTFSATSGDITVDASGFTTAPFGAGDEGRLIRVKDGASWRWLIIKTYNSPTQVVATLQGAAFGTIGAGGTSTDWRLGLYSTRLGWPAAATIHEQRLVLGGSQALPDRFDGSAIAGYEDFAPRDPITDDGAYGYALGMPGVNRIVAFAASNDLLTLTGGAAHRVAGDATGIAITPTAIWQKPLSPDGAKRIEPVQAGSAIVDVDKYGLNLRALSYDLRYQSYTSDNLTLLCDHLAWLDPDSPGFQGLAWQGNPIGTIWTIRGNGELAGILYDQKESVLGAHRHPMGAAAGEEPYVETIETVKGATHDELWVGVRRDLPGRTLRTIERMGRPGLWHTPPERQCFLDSSLSLRNLPTADLTPAATTGQGVSFRLSNVAGSFGFVAGDVGRFIKRRYYAGKSLVGAPIYRTAIARIVAVPSATEATADILVSFPSLAAIASGLWGLTVSRVTGLDPLEGLAVTAVSDGRDCAPQIVTGGAVDLDVPGWEVSAGLRYEGWLIGLPLDPGPQPVVGQGRPVRVDKITARLLASIGGEFGAVPERDDETMHWEKIAPYIQGQAAPQAAPVPFTGDKVVVAAGSWTRRAMPAVRQTQPLPFNLQLMVDHVYAPFVQP